MHHTFVSCNTYMHTRVTGLQQQTVRLYVEKQCKVKSSAQSA
jgi:hypothetical protein